MKMFLDNIELILSGAGLILIIAVPTLLFPGFIWQSAAITALSVGALHGIIFWLIRRRQRVVRDGAIREIRAMLKDVVNNQLTVISLHSEGMEEKRLEDVSRSISLISEMVNSLSEESLTKWSVRYRETLAASTRA